MSFVDESRCADHVGRTMVCAWHAVFFVGGLAIAGPWTLDTIESDVTSAARNSSIAVDSQGNVHVLYYDANASGSFELKHALLGSSGWNVNVIDAARGDRTVIEFDAQDRAHIVYNDVSGAGEIRYGVLDGGIWTLEDVPTTGLRPRNPTLALDQAGNPHVAFHDNGGAGFAAFYGTKSGAAWSIEQVGNSGLNSAFGSPTVGLDADDVPHLFGDRAGFSVATRTAGVWNIETNLGPTSRGLSVALDANGVFQIAGNTVSTDALVFLSEDSTSWTTEVIESTGPVGLADVSLVFGPLGEAHISYERAIGTTGRTEVRHATFDGSQWISELVSDSFVVQSGSSLAIDLDHLQLHMVYWSADGRLIHAMSTVVPEASSFALVAMGLVCGVIGFRRGLRLANKLADGRPFDCG